MGLLSGYVVGGDLKKAAAMAVDVWKWNNKNKGNFPIPSSFLSTYSSPNHPNPNPNRNTTFNAVASFHQLAHSRPLPNGILSSIAKMKFHSTPISPIRKFNLFGFKPSCAYWKGNPSNMIARVVPIVSQGHAYHLVDPSPWPIAGSLRALATTAFQEGETLVSLGGKIPTESLGGQTLSREDQIRILFHFSGSTCNQWRKLKNLWFPGRILFRPTSFGRGKNKDLLAHSAGPTCILYLPKEASDRLEFLPSSDSKDPDLLVLYGQYQSTLVDHMDVEKASHLDEQERSLFHFYLPGSYLSVVSSPEEFDLRKADKEV